MAVKERLELVSDILLRIREIIPDDEDRYLQFLNKAFPVIWTGVTHGHAFIIAETPKGYRVLCVKDDAQKAKD